MSPKGLLVVLSSPSGGGKTTIRRELLKRHPDFVHSVSVTARRPRSGEAAGEDYVFVSESQFRRFISEKRFLEWAAIYGNLYGTLKEPIEAAVAAAKCIIFDVDPQGALSIKRKFPNAVLVFIRHPSKSVLRERLLTRGTETPEEIEGRLKKSEEELSCSENYDYVVVNDNLHEAVKGIEGIIEKERRELKR